MHQLSLELFCDLRAVKSILFLVRDEVIRQHGSTYSPLLQAVLADCAETLRGLQDLTAKYENLGESWFDSRSPHSTVTYGSGF